jgi:hypothetical protein
MSTPATSAHGAHVTNHRGTKGTGYTVQDSYVGDVLEIEMVAGWWPLATSDEDDQPRQAPQRNWHEFPRHSIATNFCAAGSPLVSHSGRVTSISKDGPWRRLTWQRSTPVEEDLVASWFPAMARAISSSVYIWLVKLQGGTVAGPGPRSPVAPLGSVVTNQARRRYQKGGSQWSVLEPTSAQEQWTLGGGRWMNSNSETRQWRPNAWCPNTNFSIPCRNTNWAVHENIKTSGCTVEHSLHVCWSNGLDPYHTAMGTTRLCAQDVASRRTKSPELLTTACSLARRMHLDSFHAHMHTRATQRTPMH